MAAFRPTLAIALLFTLASFAAAPAASADVPRPSGATAGSAASSNSAASNNNAAPAAGAPAAADAPAAATAVAAPPAPPKPGHVTIVADASGLVAQLGGALHGLKKGPNRFEVPAGDHTVVVKTKKGAMVGSYKVSVAPEGDATIKVATVGMLVLDVADGGSLEVDGKKVKATGGVASTSVSAGSHSVVVKRPGYFGTKGSLDVVAGKRHTIDPAMEAFKGGNTTLAWVGVLGGGALIVGAVLMEAFVDASDVGGDATRWALVGVGAAGFVGGTILMKDILKKENNPPVHSGTIKAKLSLAGKGARLAFRF